MIELKARTVEDSIGVMFPKEVVDRLKIGSGDTLYLTESPDGYRLTSYSPEVACQMKVAESMMRRYEEALRELAK